MHTTGSGKTLTAVASAACVLEQFPDSKVVVVTPKSLTDNFRKEMAGYGMSKTLKRRVKITTITEFALHYEEGMCQDTFLIIDEAHNLRTERGKQAAALIECAKNAFKVMLLTATPIVNEPYDIVNLMAMIYGKEPPSKTQFYTMVKDPVQLRNFFRCKISYFSPKDRSNYPDVNNYDVKLVMDKIYYDEYIKTEERYLGIWRKEGEQQEGGEAFFSALRQAVNQIASPQMSKVNWILNKAREGEKTLIFSEFIRSTLSPLMTLLTDEGIPYAHVTGNMSRQARTDAVDAYNSGNVNVLVISSAGGEGLDLKGTRNVIITEPAWNEAKIQQITGRAVRYNSHAHLPVSDRYVNVYRLYVTKPTADERLVFGREKENQLSERPGITRKDYNIHIEGIKANIADAEDQLKDLEEPDPQDVAYFTSLIEDDKKALQETYLQWKQRVEGPALQKYNNLMEYLPIIRGLCPSSVSHYIIDSLVCYYESANAIIAADNKVIRTVQRNMEEEIRVRASERLEGVDQEKYEVMFLRWYSAYLKWRAHPNHTDKDLVYTSLTEDEMSLFARLVHDHEEGKDVDFVNAVITACLAANRDVTRAAAEELVSQRDPEINRAVLAANDFINGLYQDLRPYVANEWITARGDVYPMPPAIDHHVHDLSMNKQQQIEEFWGSLYPLTIENDDCEDGVEWQYTFKTLQQIREEKKEEREAKKKLAPEDWDWTKCDAPAGKGGYTLDQIRDFATKKGVGEQSRKNTRAGMCAVLKWKLLDDYGPDLIYLPWSDLMKVVREVGLNPNEWEKEARSYADSHRVSIADAKEAILETHGPNYNLPEPKRKLKTKLELLANRNMDWSKWDWSKCGLAPKKGGYTAQVIAAYANAHGVNLEDVVTKFRMGDRATMCAALKWKLLEEVDPAVLKIVDESTGPGAITRNSLFKMARSLNVSTVGVQIPLDQAGVEVLKKRIHQALKR